VNHVIATKAASIILLLISLVGCQSYLARRMVQAPNHGKTVSNFDVTPDKSLKSLGIDRQLRVEVGPPPASLSVWIVEPKAYEQEVTVNAKEASVTIKLKSLTKPNTLPTINPKATSICLHGLKDQKKPTFMLWGTVLARNGYRVIAVDLRGHGRSTGDWLTYGVVESMDISQLIDALEQQGLIAGKLGILGMSYGATVAIKAAAIDRRNRTV
jgi:pimeloyl-ACP methyl ester carboxylesterase